MIDSRAVSLTPTYDRNIDKFKGIFNCDFLRSHSELIFEEILANHFLELCKKRQITSTVGKEYEMFGTVKSRRRP